MLEGLTDEDFAAYADALVRDDLSVLTRPEYEELALVTVFTYAEGMRKQGGPIKPAPIKPGREKAVLDVIMTNCYMAEPLKLSVSRLCYAVGHMGFPHTTAFAAWAAYKAFPELSKEFSNGKREVENGGTPRGRARGSKRVHR